MTRIYFDIETGPLPEQELKRMMKPFRPENVRVGNLKDPEKIKAKIEEAEADWIATRIREAALRSVTCQILCIGIMDEAGKFSALTDDDGEGSMIRKFWQMLDARDQRNNMQTVQLCGWNIFHFDLPVLIQRGWRYGIPRPWKFQTRGSYMNWGDTLDLFAEWHNGLRQDFDSLDIVAKYFGVDGKNGNGADFHKLWATDRTKALAYLENDLTLTRLIAERIAPRI